MSLYWRDAANVQRTAGAIYMRDAGNVLRTVDKIQIRDADNVLREVYRQGVRLAVSPDYADGETFSSGPIYTNSVTVSVAGGTAPYTHSWSTPGFSATANTSATTAFVAHPVAGDTISGYATDTVTDANGLTNTIAVFVTITRNSYA